MRVKNSTFYSTTVNECYSNILDRCGKLSFSTRLINSKTPGCSAPASRISAPKPAIRVFGIIMHQHNEILQLGMRCTSRQVIYTLASSLLMYLHSASVIGDALSFHLTISVALTAYCINILFCAFGGPTQANDIFNEQ